MANNISHFAIHADDLDRARRFYETVFGWRFEDWGPPDFYRVHTGDEDDPGIGGALQKRREPVEGKGLIGYECTISIDDLEETQAAIEKHGGRIVFPEHQIPGVGRLVQFEDTEGNVICAMQYEPHIRAAQRR